MRGAGRRAWAGFACGAVMQRVLLRVGLAGVAIPLGWGLQRAGRVAVCFPGPVMCWGEGHE